MSEKKTLGVMLMDPPYESSNTFTAFRIIEAAIQKGHNVNVFAFEGGVGLSFAEQKAHANPVKDTSVEEEKHPLTKDFVSGLFRLAREKGVALDWVNCGFCVDERGVAHWVEGPRRGGPPDFVKQFQASDKTLMIAS